MRDEEHGRRGGDTSMEPFVMLLGTAQDGGVPQAGCEGDCCAAVWATPERWRRPACLGIVDPEAGESWMIDCTPAFAWQHRQLVADGGAPLGGVLLTHAHIGHYTGLIHLGREVMATRRMPLWVMPRMATFLTQNAPWSALMAHGHAELRPLEADEPVALSPRVAVTPWLVPHRDEYSETVAFVVQGPQRRALYVPDIDAWGLWGRGLLDVLDEVDVAFLDGTFFDDAELPHRDPAQIPHPRIADTLSLLARAPAELREKVHFIHLNHSNPAATSESPQARHVRAAGCHVGEEGWRFGLCVTNRTE